MLHSSGFAIDAHLKTKLSPNISYGGKKALLKQERVHVIKTATLLFHQAVFFGFVRSLFLIYFVNVCRIPSNSIAEFQTVHLTLVEISS